MIGNWNAKSGDIICLRQHYSWYWDPDNGAYYVSLSYGQLAVILNSKYAGHINGIEKYTLTLLTVPGCSIVESTAHWYTWFESWEVICVSP